MSRKFLVPIQLPADPTAALEAATKQYVDGKVGAAAPSEVDIAAADPIGTNPASELWYDTAAAAGSVLASQVAFTPGGSIAATDVQSAITEVANEAPRGITAWKHSTLTDGQGLTTTPQTVWSIAVTLTAGRMYELTFTSRALYGPQYVRFTCSPSPAIPHGGGNWQVDAYVYAPAIYGNIAWSGIFVIPTTQTYTFNIQVVANSNGGGVWANQSGGSNAWIKDIGAAIGAS